MIGTYGLTHIGLAVRDVERALRFYEDVFGARAVYRETGTIQAQTPGSHDILSFEDDASKAGEMKGVTHFGFRLRKLEDIEAAAIAVQRAGGKILEQGEFLPGEPYIFASDPDGYRIEIWYE